MRVAVTIQHPAHVHFYKHVVQALDDAGHQVDVLVKGKDIAEQLLDRLGIPHTVLVKSAEAGWDVVIQQLRYEFRLLRRLRQTSPDVVTAIGGMAASHVSGVTGIPSVVFTDSEHRSNRLMAPFADAIFTPRHFTMDLGPRHRRYDGFQELAYLHPNWFQPAPDVLRDHGVDPDGPYSVVRFSDMNAHHDAGEAGFSERGRRALIDILDDHGTTFVAAEGSVDASFGRTLPVPPDLFHHLLAFADLVVSDSSTTATEAGLLGTPTVRSNSFAGADDLSNFVQLEQYGLVQSIPDEWEAIERCRTLVEDPNASARWQSRRRALLAKTVDVIPFVLEELGRAGGAPETVPSPEAFERGDCNPWERSAI